MKYDSGKRRGKLFGRPQRGPLLPLSLFVLALLIYLFSLIPPAQLIGQTLLPGKVIVPSATASSTPLPRPTDIHGGHIVFTCTRGDYNQICMINADSTGFQQLTRVDRNEYYPTISPQGDAVVFASNRNGNFDLYALVLSTSKLIQLTKDVGNAFSPTFSPDGKQIAFLNRPGDGPTALWIMSRTGENPHLLYAGPNTIVAAKWSPHGDSIAFAMAVERTFAFEIFLLDTSQPKQPPRRISQGIPDIGGSLDWSPDESNLLIYAGPAGAREIYRLDIATGATTQLTFGGNNAAASYSPDGLYVVYNSLRNNNQADLYIMRSDGHSTRQLTNFPEPDWQPQWSP